MKFNIKYLFYIVFLLFPLQALILPLGSSIYFTFFSIFIVFLYFLLFTLKYKKIMTFVKIMSKNSLFITFNTFMLIIFITIFINALYGHLKISTLYYLHHYRDLLICVYLLYLLPSLALFLGIKIRQIFKIYVILMFFILCIGIIDYIAVVFNISFLKTFVNLFRNKFFWEGYLYISHDFAADKARAYSVFSEPSEFAQFLFITLPITYSICLSKVKLFKNRILNYITNNYLIYLIWLNIILTKSPIFLIFCILIHIIYFRKKVLYLLKNFFIPMLLLITLILVLIFINKQNIEASYLNRILKTFVSLNSFDALVLIEPSLATRLVGYINSLRVFVEHWFIGVGFYNNGAYIYDVYKSSPITLTPENIVKMATNPYNVAFSRGLIYTLLAETGIFGFLAGIWFYIKHFNILTKLNNITATKYNIYYGLQVSLIAILINSFYNLFFEKTVIWFVFGLVLLCSVNVKR